MKARNFKAHNTYKCPLTQGCKTRFLSMDTYKRNCWFYQRKVRLGINRRTVPMYEYTCSKCVNYRDPKKPVHGASIIGVVEAKALMKEYGGKAVEVVKKRKPHVEGLDFLSPYLDFDELNNI